MRFIKNYLSFPLLLRCSIKKKIQLVRTSAVNDSGSRALCISPVAALAAAQYLRNHDQRDPSLVHIDNLNQFK